MVICPYCEQGRIIKARLKADISGCSDSQIIRYCEECDTVWREDEPVSDRTGSSLYLMAEKLSVSEKTLWDQMEILG